MLVYGKASRCGDPRDLLAEVARLHTLAARAPGDIRRHGALVSALVAAGTLLQGLADADFAVRGSDAPSPGQDAATALLLRLAAAVVASWETGFGAGVPDLGATLAAFEPRALPATVTTRWAEGFAYYALYPEACAVAARRSGLGPDTHVVGLRSIGAPLAAMVAAALGSGRLSTVRPVGHPYRRTLSLSPALEATLREAPAIAVVDEGPGLSGSSFGGCLDALRGLGVPEDRIALFPSHAGEPGARASAAHRQAWTRLSRHSVPFAALILDPERPEQALETWFADSLGPPEAPLEEISGGAWRHHLYANASSWPPVNAWQERRKFLLRARGGPWRLTFAGLGPEAARRAERAKTLAEAGFAPEVQGLRHGFLAERWHAAGVPLAPDRAENEHRIDAIGRYLGFRARAFPAEGRSGAALPELLAMARHNIGAALGADVTRVLDVWTADELADVAATIRPVETDNRMQPWKWLALPDGRLLKTDGTDHHAGHDLIGCQDIAWDVVGAVQEFGFATAGQARLTAIVARDRDRAIDPRLTAILTPCYLAFRVGALTLARDAAADPAERQRLQRGLARQTGRLRTSLGRIARP